VKLNKGTATADGYITVVSGKYFPLEDDWYKTFDIKQDQGTTQM